MSPSQSSAVRERILASAFDLFYRQGYRATGINQIIAASGTAKASFYDHFPSKDDLLLAYARAMAERELASIREEVLALPSPRERFFGPLAILPAWLRTSDFRGCPFQNLVAEAPPDHWRLREVARDYRESLRVFLGELLDALVASEPRLAGIDGERLLLTYMLLFEGAIALAVAYRQPWPVDAAIQALEERLAPA